MAFEKEHPSFLVDSQLENMYQNKIYCLSDEVINEPRLEYGCLDR